MKPSAAQLALAREWYEAMPELGRTRVVAAHLADLRRLLGVAEPAPLGVSVRPDGLPLAAPDRRGRRVHQVFASPGWSSPYSGRTRAYPSVLELWVRAEARLVTAPERFVLAPRAVRLAMHAVSDERVLAMILTPEVWIEMALR